MSTTPRSPCALLSSAPRLTGPVKEVSFLTDDTAELQLLWSQTVLRSLAGVEVPVSVILRRALEVYVQGLQEGHKEASQVLGLTQSRVISQEVRQKLTARFLEMKEQGAIPDEFTREMNSASWQ